MPLACKLQVQHIHLRAIYLIFKRFCTHESAFLWELSLEKYFSSELSHLIWGRKVGRWCPWDAIYVGGVKRRSSFAYFFKFIGRLRFQGNSTHFNGHIYCTLNAQLSAWGEFLFLSIMLWMIWMRWNETCVAHISWYYLEVSRLESKQKMTPEKSMRRAS